MFGRTKTIVVPSCQNRGRQKGPSGLVVRRRVSPIYYYYCCQKSLFPETLALLLNFIMVYKII